MAGLESHETESRATSTKQGADREPWSPLAHAGRRRAAIPGSLAVALPLAYTVLLGGCFRDPPPRPVLTAADGGIEHLSEPDLAPGTEAGTQVGGFDVAGYRDAEGADLVHRPDAAAELDESDGPQVPAPGDADAGPTDSRDSFASVHEVGMNGDVDTKPAVPTDTLVRVHDGSAGGDDPAGHSDGAADSDASVDVPGGCAGGVRVSGTVAGQTWTRSGSPYVLVGDLSVASLIIESGVTVEASASFVFDVVGKIAAVGTAEAPIVFRAAPCNKEGWLGIRFNSAQPTSLSHISVEDSTAGGVRIIDSSVDLLNAAIHDNAAAQGGGVFVQGAAARVTIRNGLISRNIADDFFEAGGGLFVRDGATVTMENTIVNDNRTVYANARGGGVFVCGGTVTVQNSVLVGNGGSLYGTGSGGLAVNTGGLSNCGGALSVNIRNSIVFDNVPFQLSPGVTVSYSDVQGGFAGTGNIANNPIFADSTFHLLDGASPCTDGGDPSTSDDACFPPSLGTSRNDMGAYGGPGACSW